MSKPKTCTVCFEDFGKYMKPVPCPSCPADKLPSICRPCTEEYLLESPKDAHCMQCNHAWGYQFMHEAFPKEFITKTYRKSRQEKALERERGLLQQTLPLVAAEKEKAEAKERLKVWKQEADALKAEYLAKYRVIDDKIKVETLIIRSGGSKTFVTKYLFACPVSKKGEACRGFIESNTWCCGLCDVKICRKCHCIEKEKHKCKKDNVETAKMVMAETKPCPKCTTRIFKIAGCDQMFCTQCQTPFSWNTGQIVTGVIHNPHYYEMMRQTGIAPRNAGDAPCGGMPWFDHIHPHSKICDDDTRERITTAHRRCSEIENYINRQRTRLNGMNFEDIRLRWLLGEFKDEKAWQRSIFIRERNINKKREELTILDTFLTGSIERFNDYITSCEELGEKKTVRKRELATKLLSDIEQIKKFCNTAFEKNFKALEYYKWPCIDFTREYGTNKGNANGHVVIE